VNSSGDPADIAATAASDAVLRESGSVIGFGTVATAGIADDAVTNAKLANVATATFKGRTTAGTGDPEDLTATQATALLNVFVGDSGSGGTKGLVPAPAAGDAAKDFFLHADGTWKGSWNVQIASPAGNYTVLAEDCVIFGVAGNTITLPTPVGIGGRIYVVKRASGVGLLTVATAAGNIDGSATDLLGIPQSAGTYVSDGTDWRKV
jgi:hypothetical protein